MSDRLAASEDLAYLLSRGYNKRSAINFVACGYSLNERDTNYLKRCVFSESKAKLHQSKLIDSCAIINNSVVIDGYNLLITVETMLNGGELIECMDGFLRDNSAVFSKYVFDGYTKKAVKKIIKTLKEYRPHDVLFIFDSQISKSGELAAYVRRKLSDFSLGGDARTSPHADSDIVKLNQITVSTDSIIIERVDKVFDLGRVIFSGLKGCKLLCD